MVATFLETGTDQVTLADRWDVVRGALRCRAAGYPGSGLGAGLRTTADLVFAALAAMAAAALVAVELGPLTQVHEVTSTYRTPNGTLQEYTTSFGGVNLFGPFLSYGSVAFLAVLGAAAIRPFAPAVRWTRALLGLATKERNRCTSVTVSA